MNLLKDIIKLYFDTCCYGLWQDDQTLALTDALGRDGAAMFMRHSAGKPGRDFAKWLSEQPETNDEDFEAEIAKIAADDMASGRLAGKMVI